MDLSVLILLCVGAPVGSSVGLPPVVDITQLESADPRCRADITALRQGLDTGQLWAQTMVDAGVKAPVGLLSQTAVQFGDFDECLTVSSPVAAQFCLVDISPIKRNHTEWAPFKWGVCVPSSCSPKEVERSLQTYMTRKGQEVEVGVIPVACTTKDTVSRSLTPADFFYCALMAVIFVAVFIATVSDIRSRPDYDGVSDPGTLGECLSARTGIYSLLRVDQPIPGVNLSPLYGLHSCACFFVVLGHRFGFHLLFMTLTNYRSVERMFVGSWFSIWAGHVDLFVDIFFFMSAFLLAVLYYAILHKRYVSPFMVYLHRLCRLVPVYAVVIFFYVTVLRQLGDGPLWNMFMDEEQGKCRGYWWTNLLFINTYVETENICLIQSWFLSCEFQLFVAGTLLVLLLKKNAQLGVVVTVIVFLLSTMAPFLGTYLYDRPAMLLFTKEFWNTARHHDLFFSVYSEGHYRGTSYLMGILAGCYVYKNREHQFSRSRTYLLQILGILCCLVVYWSGCLFYDQSDPFSRLVNATYAAFFHTAFAIGLSLLIISLTLGKITALSALLSWNGFVPLSKLSYCVFLVHGLPIFFWLASSRTPVHMSPLELISWTIADVVLSLIVSLVLCLTVETPGRHLVKYLITGRPLSTTLPKCVDPQEANSLNKTGEVQKC